MRKIPVLAATITTAVATAVALGAGTAGADQQYEVVASGLNNPRQLSFTPNGALFVAESGRGGDGPCMIGGEGDEVCFGLSGSITKVHHGTQRRVLTDLPSLATEDGSQASGPADVEVTGNQQFVVSIGLGTNPANRAQLPASGQAMGTLIQGTFNRGWSTMADIAGHEAQTNPIDDPDSNPTGVLRHGGTYLNTDSGGNTLLMATRTGRVRTLAAFPDRMVDAPPFLGLPPGTQLPMQAVPTSVVRGPDGAFYVSQLTGFPFPPGGSNIYRVMPGHTPTVYATGLTNVTDLAFAPDGTLYAVEIAEQGLLNGPVGALVKVAPAASGGQNEVVLNGLTAPYGVALRGGDAFVTTCSVCAGGGQVIKVDLG